MSIFTLIQDIIIVFFTTYWWYFFEHTRDSETQASECEAAGRPRVGFAREVFRGFPLVALYFVTSTLVLVAFPVCAVDTDTQTTNLFVDPVMLVQPTWLRVRRVEGTRATQSIERLSGTYVCALLTETPFHGRLFPSEPFTWASS